MRLATRRLSRTISFPRLKCARSGDATVFDSRSVPTCGNQENTTLWVPAFAGTNGRGSPVHSRVSGNPGENLQRGNTLAPGLRAGRTELGCSRLLHRFIAEPFRN